MTLSEPNVEIRDGVAYYAGTSTPFDLTPFLLEPPVSTTVVQVDPVRSHITITADPPGQPDGAFVDLGPVLRWWSHRALELDPTGARQLAAGLIDWADRRDPPTPTGGPT